MSASFREAEGHFHKGYINTLLIRENKVNDRELTEQPRAAFITTAKINSDFFSRF